ncbi:hypothetical protein L1887_14897 [Cichorium endivia]|nr:hypothetical protein L1887_14897 [Cichorium endivia]
MNIGDTIAGPSKRKAKKIREDDEDEEVEISEAAKLARAVREKELDDLLRISKELDAEDAAKQDAAFQLETQKLHFPGWGYETMKKEAITQPIQNWLQPNCSYDIRNQVNSQFDFPMTARRKKIVKLTPRMPQVISPFRNPIFLARRGSDEEKDEFTLADLPFMNPFDWVSLFNILSRREDHEIIHEHVNKLLMGYILEVAKLDVEVATVLNSTLECSAKKPPSDLNRRRLGKIKNKDWNVAYPSKEGHESVKRIFFLRDKHLYRTPALKKILDLINKTRGNSENDKRCLNDMLTWYIAFRKRILLLIPKVFEKLLKVAKPEVEE